MRYPIPVSHWGCRVVPLAAITIAALLGTGCGGRQPQTAPTPPRETAPGVNAPTRAEVSYPAPDMVLRTLAGDTISTRDYRGRVLVVCFWATWCKPCLRAADYLARLAPDQEPPDPAMLGIALNDPDSAAVLAHVSDLAMPYPVIVDVDGRIADAYGGVYVLPTTFLVSRDGSVVTRISGLASPDSLAAWIRSVSGR